MAVARPIIKATLHPMADLLDWKTRKATAFYVVLGLVAREVWSQGFNRWTVGLSVLLAGLGTLSAVARAVWGRLEPQSPAEGRPGASAEPPEA